MKRILLSSCAVFATMLPGATFPRPCASFTVTSTADSGAGSLRQAILDANANPGVDTINFNIPGPIPGYVEIVLASQLPPITDPVNLDANNNGTPVIVNGAAVPAPHAVLTLSAGSSTIESLILVDGNDAGLRIQTNGGNKIQLCRIGGLFTNPASFRLNRPNAGPGIDVEGGAGHVLYGNQILFNGGPGVVVRSAATGVEFSQNRIRSNGGMAIDLGGDGRTPNDSGDGDTGANTLLNHPILERIEVVGASNHHRDFRIWGRLEAAPFTTYEIRFFTGTLGSNKDDLDVSEHPDGKSTITTDATGLASFMTTTGVFPETFENLAYAVATKDSAGNMSELSVPVAVPNFTVNSGCGACGLEWLIVPALAAWRRRRRATSAP